MRAILVINAGSSTIKFAIFTLKNNVLLKKYAGLIDKILTSPVMQIKALNNNTKTTVNLEKTSTDAYTNAFDAILNWLDKNNIELIAAGHRMIHGGETYLKPIIIDANNLAFLEKLSPLAPLHQPYNLQGAKILFKQHPNLFQTASFDTSFHATCDKTSQQFAIPRELAAEGVRRYGFHGLSYDYVINQFDKYLPKEKVNGKVIVMHLGGGATMCAIQNKKSVATSIGFSAVDGLIMGTRCGTIDAGVLLYLMKYKNMGYEEINNLLYKQSGLLGISGKSADMRDLLNSDSPGAKLAVDMFVQRVTHWLGALAMQLQGVDALVFTAGIGENAPLIREKICNQAGWLGVKLDANKNANNENSIHSPESRVSIHIIPTDEEFTIAKDTWTLYNKKAV